MSSTSPHHRSVIVSDTKPDSEILKLPWYLNALRFLGLAVIAMLLLTMIQPGIGTMESRITYLLAFALALINPVWGMYALALVGPLFLLDQSKTHMLAMLDVLALGMLASELRLWNRTPPKLALDRIESSRRNLPALRVYWGLWPHALTGLGLMLVASAMVGVLHVLTMEYFARFAAGEAPASLLRRLDMITRWSIYGAATEYEWTIKSLFNWLTGMTIACIAARRMDLISAARFLKLGSLSLLVACGVAMLEWGGWMSLTDIRRANPDPLQIGRLQGPAGHPGWFGQWIVLMWPGLLLWMSSGRTKRNIVVGSSLCLVLLALVLTAARAAWLGVAVGSCVGVLFLISSYPNLKRYLWAALAAALVIVAVGVLAGGDILQSRLVNLLRVQDRLNYYVSGLIFLRDYPLGLGLGNHFRYYDWTFTPLWSFFQKDHVTAHSLWLHTLIENGPFVTAMIAGVFVGLAAEVRKSLPLFDRESRNIVAALSISLLGVLAISVAQYVVYLRVVELTIWIMGGVLVGLCRRRRALIPDDEEVESVRGPRLLLLCGVGAVVIASFNSSRAEVGRMPWSINSHEHQMPDFWIGREWRTPVGRDVEKVSFSLLRNGLEGEVTILVPGHDPMVVTMQPGEHRYFEFPVEPIEVSRFAAPRWMKVQLSHGWTPALWEEGSNDDRSLGVYIISLTMKQVGEEMESAPTEE